MIRSKGRHELHEGLKLGQEKVNGLIDTTNATEGNTSYHSLTGGMFSLS